MSEPEVERTLGTGAKDKYDTPEEEAAARRTAGLPDQAPVDQAEGDEQPLNESPDAAHLDNPPL